MYQIPKTYQLYWFLCVKYWVLLSHTFLHFEHKLKQVRWSFLSLEFAAISTVDPNEMKRRALDWWDERAPSHGAPKLYPYEVSNIHWNYICRKVQCLNLFLPEARGCIEFYSLGHGRKLGSWYSEKSKGVQHLIPIIIQVLFDCFFHSRYNVLTFPIPMVL